MTTAGAAADILVMTRAESRIPRTERVSRLISAGDPAPVLDELFPNALFDPESDAARAQARQDVDRWLRAGYTITSVLSDRYPQSLAGVREAPALLFSEGVLDPEDVGVSVVGSRSASGAELQAAADIARALVAAGLTVVSGLAAGIDTAAHEAALDAGGRTVAIMGTGLEHTYPAANTALRGRIVRSGGLVASQFEPGFSGSKQAFPMRNAVMSGYGTVTVVVAASEHSGTRHQARAAQGHGRALIMTPAVSTGASWGREFTGRGNVFVARSPDEVAEAAVEAARIQRDGAGLFA